MWIYSNDNSANPARAYGSDAVARHLAKTGARAIHLIEGPDAIGCYLVTFDNAEQIEVSNGEQIASEVRCKGLSTILSGAYLQGRESIKRWLVTVLAANAASRLAADIAASEVKALRG